MVSFKITDILNTAEGVKNHIEQYNEIPPTVNVAGVNYLTSQFSDIMTRTILQLDPRQKTINYNDIQNRPVNFPSTSIENITLSELDLNNYVDLADKVYGDTNEDMIFPEAGRRGDTFISYQGLVYAFARILTWYKVKGEMPTRVYLKKWTGKPAIGSGGNLTSKGPIQTACEKLLGIFTNFTGFYNKCKGRGYGNYYNDVKTLAEEEATIANLNCADASQLAYNLAKEMGYSVRYCHVYCTKSGSGHIYLQVKGNELGSNWVKVDLAAAMSVSSQYNIGSVWCSDASISSYDDQWLMSDDGKT